MMKHLPVAYLKERLAKTNRAVKTALLDQKAVVGLGNIYVDEALFRARIHPETKANSLSDGQIKTLHTEIKDTLQEAIDAGGSTVRSYINSQGKSECFSSNITSYGKKDEPCKTCGTMISKIVVGGRGTHFAPAPKKS